MFEISWLRLFRGFFLATSGVFLRQLRIAAGLAFGGLRVRASILMVALLLQPFGLSGSWPATMNAKAAEAFANYVRATETRNNSELQRGTELLWIDGLPDAARETAYAELAQGGVELRQRAAADADRQIPCPGCMIHHWEGLVFIPHAHLEDVLRVLQDYNHHSEYYAPDVVQSRIEARDGGHLRVFLRFRRQKVITVVLNTEHEITYFRDSPERAHSRSSATHIGEVENPGKASEREKPRGDDNGFLWGMETWWRMQEKENGVYVQSEIVSLTRDIPTGLGWMIGPFVTAVPKESLNFTLAATRKAVLAQLGGKSSK